MHEKDIKDFFPAVTAGTAVTIVDMPSKVGWENDKLLLETYVPLEEHSNEYYAGFNGIVDAIQSASSNTKTFVDWQSVTELSETRDGQPHDIGFKIPG
jgi:L,D-transpeptidase ErfK/SrfK